MAHPYQQYREKHPGQKKAKERVGKHSDIKEDTVLVKKAMAAHDKQMHGGKHTDLKSIGMKSGGRLDKYARGGKAKAKKSGSHTKINIMVAPKSGEGPPPALPPSPIGAAPPPPMPPKMPMPPPPGPMGGPMKRGGKVKMTAGADSGEGRLQKARAQKGK